ncbi:Uncharacterised protein [Legionella beliardensis]|uniref:Uncharacterized protein n=1 Tax=Legionella beliardensis TaxID=91822 RepID=A0A378I3J5_9GAMM|nr:hypothetical protein [Legionella beliardensis]STX29295.1 Uncharacterised protein [Legionella beliardensis]
MSNYFDPIMQQDIDLDENTLAYLVKLSDEKFSIKAISSGLDKLPSDPTTHATAYWPINIKSLLDQTDNDVLFQEGKLTTQSITKEQVITLFGFDPDKISPVQFNPSIKEELVDNWANEVVRDEFSHASQNIHLFFRPISVQQHSGNNQVQQEDEGLVSNFSFMISIPLAIMSSPNPQEQIAEITSTMFRAFFAHLENEARLANESDMQSTQETPRPS